MCRVRLPYLSRGCGLTLFGTLASLGAVVPPRQPPPGQSLAAQQAQRVVGSYEGILAGNYRIRLQLSAQAATLTGQYYYLRTGRLLRLTGQVAPSGQVTLQESVEPDTATTGWFQGRRQPNGALVGTWRRATGAAPQPFELTRLVGTTMPANARAQVRAKTYDHSFTIPVVTVPDAGVSKLLSQWFSLESLSGETPASLRASLRDQQAEGIIAGIQQLQYKVVYNRQGLLCITTLTEGSGASVWYDQHTQTIDLATGFPLVLADELKPELIPAFLALGQQKLHRVTRAYVPTQDGFLKPNDVAGVLSQTFSLGSTAAYTLSATGLSCDHPISYDGMSNFVYKVLVGNFEVKFSQAELGHFLKPDSPLRRCLLNLPSQP
jgi:hypothetical protein